MTSTLQDINAQLAALEAEAASLRRQAEDIRKAELAAVIDEVIKKIAEYGLTAFDLKLSPRAGRGKKAASTKGAAKYRGPNGEAWSGGRGCKPRWVTEALAEGKSLSAFEVK